MNLAAIAVGLTSLLDMTPQTRSHGITVVIGKVEFKSGASSAYAAAAVGTTVENDAWIRTAQGARTAVELADGSELFLNESTEVQVRFARRVALKLGSLYIRTVEKPEEFVVETLYAKLETPGATFTAGFAKRVTKGPDLKAPAKTVTNVMVLEGKVRVVPRHHPQTVTAGYNCDMLDSQLNTPEVNGNATVATRWIHLILAARGKAGPDVQMRVESCLARLGSQAKDDPYEAALRDLGSLAAGSLAEYLKYRGSPAEADRRRSAARVLADICPDTAAAGLLPLLRDTDAEVKTAGVRGLQRLTGKDFGMDEKAWADYLGSDKK